MRTNSPARHRQNGFVVIALITIMGLMSLYVATNLRTLAALKQELQLIEHKQVEHWRK